MSKVVAVMEKPKGCYYCPFSVCKWSNPWWTRDKVNTRGQYCSLVDVEKREIFVSCYDDKLYKWDKCPLKPFEEVKK